MNVYIITVVPYNAAYIDVDLEPPNIDDTICCTLSEQDLLLEIPGMISSTIYSQRQEFCVQESNLGSCTNDQRPNQLG